MKCHMEAPGRAEEYLFCAHWSIGQRGYDLFAVVHKDLNAVLVHEDSQLDRAGLLRQRHLPNGQQIPGTPGVGAICGEGICSAVVNQGGIKPLISSDTDLQLFAFRWIELYRHIEDSACHFRKLFEFQRSDAVKVKVNVMAMRKWALQYALYTRILSPSSLAEQVKRDLEEARNNYESEEKSHE